jgi:iron complex outermembrane receptor protein
MVLAISGAINLSTIKPEKGKTSIGQEVMMGNYGLQRYTTQFEMDNERSSIVLNYGHQKSDGFSIHNKSKRILSTSPAISGHLKNKASIPMLVTAIAMMNDWAN